MNIKEAIEFGKDQLDVFGGDMYEFLVASIVALEVIDKSNHICLTCANNREGGCEPQDLLCCKHYDELCCC